MSHQVNSLIKYSMVHGVSSKALNYWDGHEISCIVISENSIQCSQKLTTELLTEPLQSRPHISLTSVLILYFHLQLCFQSCVFSWDFWYTHSCYYMLHPPKSTYPTHYILLSLMTLVNNLHDQEKTVCMHVCSCACVVIMERIHILRNLYLILDSSSMVMSITQAIKAVSKPINKKINHLARFFFTMNLYPFVRSSSSRRWFSQIS